MDDARQRPPAAVEWLGNRIEASTDPVSGLVCLTWAETRTGRHAGSRVLDGPELDQVIGALDQVRVGLIVRFGSGGGPVRIDMGAFLDAVLKRTPSRP
jgi:hypothetical protein